MKTLTIKSEQGNVILKASSSSKLRNIAFEIPSSMNGVEFKRFKKQNKAKIDQFKDEVEIDILISKIPNLKPVLNFEAGQESIKVSNSINGITLEFLLIYRHTNLIICPENKSEPEQSKDIFTPEDIEEISLYKDSEKLFPTVEQLSNIYISLNLSKIMNKYEQA